MGAVALLSHDESSALTNVKAFQTWTVRRIPWSIHRTVLVALWVSILCLAIAAKMEWSKSGIALLCFSALVLFIASIKTRKRWVKTTLLMFFIGGLASAYGALYTIECPLHPVTSPGIQTTMHGTVTSIKTKGKLTETLVSVSSEDSVRVRYNALVLQYGAVSVSQGQRVTVKGMFLADTHPPTIQDILSPIWFVEGRVTPVSYTVRATNWVNDIQTSMQQSVPQSSAADVGLALSMVIGRSAPLSTATQSLFLSAGVTHLLVASGANVSLVCRFAALPWTLWRLCFRRSYMRIETCYQLVVVWLFANVCGNTIPVVRAALFSTYELSGRLVHRRILPLIALSVSCFLFEVVQPYGLTQASGILSIVATFAVFDATTLWQKASQAHRIHHPLVRADGLHSWLISRSRYACQHLLQVLFVTVLVETYVIPIVWWLFQQFTPYAFASTVLMEPMLVLLLPLTLIWTCVAFVATTVHVSLFLLVAHLLGLLDMGIIGICTRVLTMISKFRFSLVPMPVLPTWLFGAYFVALCVWRTFTLPNARDTNRPGMQNRVKSNSL